MPAPKMAKTSEAPNTRFLGQAWKWMATQKVLAQKEQIQRGARRTPQTPDTVGYQWYPHHGTSGGWRSKQHGINTTWSILQLLFCDRQDHSNSERRARNKRTKPPGRWGGPPGNALRRIWESISKRYKNEGETHSWQISLNEWEGSR